MNRRSLAVILTVVVVAVVAWMVINANQGSSDKPKIAIFNLLSHPILDDSVAGLKEGLAEAGYGPDKATYVEINANGEMDKLNAFAKELLAGNPTLIIPVSTPVTQAVFKEARASQQILFSTVTNPSDVGMDDDPENMTGVSDAVNYAANLDLIREMFGDAKHIGMIYNAGERNSQFGIDRVKELVGERGFTLEIVAVSKSSEVPDAARNLIPKIDVIYVGSDNTVVSAMAGLVKVAYDAKVPVIASDSGSVQEGALAAVSVDYRELGRTAGELAGRILSTGKKAGSFELVSYLGNSVLLNDEAAKRLGYEVPKAVRERAEVVSK